jgi:hypothetical protein
MAFTVKPLAALLALTSEKVDELLAPVRARGIKAKADLEQAKIEEKLISLEGEINKLCANKELDFDVIVGKMNEYDLLERKLKQIKQLISELFPTN